MASVGAPAASTQPSLPSGITVLRTVPYAFMLPEILLQQDFAMSCLCWHTWLPTVNLGGIFTTFCGTWVWILVAATSVSSPLEQGWVMYVSLSSCLISLLILLGYISGFHTNSENWKVLDSMYHGITAILYLSAAVLQANVAIRSEFSINSSPLYYHLNCAAVFFAFITTFLYILHAFRIYYH